MALGRRGIPPQTAVVAVQHQRDRCAGWPVLIGRKDVEVIRREHEGDMAQRANTIASAGAPDGKGSRRRVVQRAIRRPEKGELGPRPVNSVSSDGRQAIEAVDTDIGPIDALAADPTGRGNALSKERRGEREWAHASRYAS